MAHNEAPVKVFNTKIIKLEEFGGTDVPTKTAGLSGALALSGGNLYFFGDTTATRLAVI